MIRILLVRTKILEPQRCTVFGNAIWVKLPGASNFIQIIEGTTGAFTPEAFGTVPAAEFYGSSARQFMALPRTAGVSLNYDF